MSLETRAFLFCSNDEDREGGKETWTCDETCEAQQLIIMGFVRKTGWVACRTEISFHRAHKLSCEKLQFVHCKSRINNIYTQYMHTYIQAHKKHKRC